MQALRGVNFTLYQAEFVVITGPSGSGKTTLLNIIGTLDKPSSGTVTIDGEDITGMKDEDRFRLPIPQPHPRPDGPRERGAAVVDCRNETEARQRAGKPNA